MRIEMAGSSSESPFTPDPTLGGKIAPPSFQSLYLRLKFGDTLLATGTGFLVQTHTGVALITARHNLTGRHHETHECLHERAGIPDRLEIVHNALTSGMSVIRTESLLTEGEPRWIEHPTLGDRCDVALLPLTNLAHVLVAPYDWQRSYPNIAVKVAEPVSVVGFPLNQTGGARWLSGALAISRRSPPKTMLGNRNFSWIVAAVEDNPDHQLSRFVMAPTTCKMVEPQFQMDRLGDP